MLQQKFILEVKVAWFYFKKIMDYKHEVPANATLQSSYRFSTISRAATLGENVHPVSLPDLPNRYVQSLQLR